MTYKEFIKDPRCKAGARCFGAYSLLVQEYEIRFRDVEDVYAKEVVENAPFPTAPIRLPSYMEYFFNEADALLYILGQLQLRIAEYEGRLKNLDGAF
ncbi:MAG: hypothetical protein ACOCOC_08900 [Prevotella sp.]